MLAWFRATLLLTLLQSSLCIFKNGFVGVNEIPDPGVKVATKWGAKNNISPSFGVVEAFENNDSGVVPNKPPFT